MKLFLLAILLSRFTSHVLCAAEPPSGEWHNIDIRSVEVLPKGCIRLWLEERAYMIRTVGDHLEGGYRNVVRATPVGMPSFSPDCKFPPPASNPVAMQMRLWAIIGRSNSRGGWRIGAEPGVGAGNFQTLKTEEFQTLITQRDDLLIDGDNPADPLNTLIFRRAGAPPAAARASLEHTIDRLNGGSCLEIISALGTNSDLAVQACALRARLLDLSGRYLSLTVDSATEFDRVPEQSSSGSPTMKRQHGVFFSFMGKYEKNDAPGNAILYEDGGKWRLAQLWF